MLMAALAVYEAGGTPDRSEIRTALTGNLCRCTGYEPIIAAIEAALAAREEVPG
jgi:carbon-monoxide dehydrogenase small subunit